MVFLYGFLITLVPTIIDSGSHRHLRLCGGVTYSLNWIFYLYRYFSRPRKEAPTTGGALGSLLNILVSNSHYLYGARATCITDIRISILSIWLRSYKSMSEGCCVDDVQVGTAVHFICMFRVLSCWSFFFLEAAECDSGLILSLSSSFRPRPALRVSFVEPDELILREVSNLSPCSFYGFQSTLARYQPNLAQCHCIFCFGLSLPEMYAGHTLDH